MKNTLFLESLSVLLAGILFIPMLLFVFAVFVTVFLTSDVMKFVKNMR